MASEAAKQLRWKRIRRYSDWIRRGRDRSSCKRVLWGQFRLGSAVSKWMSDLLQGTWSCDCKGRRKALDFGQMKADSSGGTESWTLWTDLSGIPSLRSERLWQKKNPCRLFLMRHSGMYDENVWWYTSCNLTEWSRKEQEDRYWSLPARSVRWNWLEQSGITYHKKLFWNRGDALLAARKREKEITGCPGFSAKTQRCRLQNNINMLVLFWRLRGRTKDLKMQAIELGASLLQGNI